MTSSAERSASIGALSHLRVLDLTGPLGQMCARVFADMGADVVKVEAPGGDPARGIGPFAGDEPGPNRSLVFMDRNRGKRSIILDLTDEGDREKIRAFAARVDVVVEDSKPGALAAIGLGFDDLSQVNPELVYVSITPFGQTGPQSGYIGGELIAQATGGILFANGDDGQRPAMAPDDLISNISCLHAAFGALAAIRQRRETGRGQHVDVSRQEVVLYCQGNYIPRYSTMGRVTKREGRHGAMGGVNLFTCADGDFISLAPFMAHHFRRLATDVIGDDVLANPELESNPARNEDATRVLINERIEKYAATVMRDDFVERGQNAGVPAVPVMTPEEALGHPHNAERAFFHEVDDRIGQRTVPGAPFRMTGTPWRVDFPVPTVGQHTDAVLAELDRPADRPERLSLDGETGGAGALGGLRVTDFTRAFAGPIATMFLGFLGAQVVKLESGDLEDNRGGGQATFQELNRAKLSATIDTRKPEGKDLIKQLVSRSDLVVENFRPNVMDRLELDYEALSAAKPDLIMVSMPGFGRTGPLKDYYAYGQQIIGTTGLLTLWGHPESSLDVRVKYAFPDYVAAIAASLACLAALEHRNETGRGQFIELAQFESLAHLLGVTYMDSTSNGRVQTSRGNESWTHAPHDVFRCAGDDEWVAIAVETGEQWAALVEAMGSPAWSEDGRFSSLGDRRANKRALDAHINEWTESRGRREVEALLQGVGVPAGILATAKDLIDDPHLRSRGEIVDVDHGEDGGGVIAHAGPNVHLSGGPSRADLPSPGKGEHNDVVFRAVLGLSDQEESELEAAAVLR